MLSRTHSRRRWRIVAAALAVLALGAPVSHAQLPAPPATTEAALHQMFDQAGVIFIGQVTAIRRVESVIEIDFSVDDAILGVAPNTKYTLREWTGVSPAAASQFAVPQFEIARRYLMLLHTPGPSGLSSPIGGPDGAIPILPTAEPALPNTPDSAGLAAQTALMQTTQSANNAPPRSPAHTTFRLGPAVDSAAVPSPIPAALANSSALASSVIDLRWIATRVLTPLAYAPSGPASAHPITTQARLSRTAPGTQLLATSPGYTASSLPQLLSAAGSAALETTPSTQPTRSSTYADVLTLLRSWQAQPNAAR